MADLPPLRLAANRLIAGHAKRQARSSLTRPRTAQGTVGRRQFGGLKWPKSIEALCLGLLQNACDVFAEPQPNDPRRWRACGGGRLSGLRLVGAAGAAASWGGRHGGFRRLSQGLRILG